MEDPLIEPLQFFLRIVFDFDSAALIRLFDDSHARAQAASSSATAALIFGSWSGSSDGLPRLVDLFDQSFHLPDREALSGSLLGKLSLQFRRRQAENRSRMAHGKAPFGHQKLDFARQPQQANHVRDGGSILACPRCDLLVAEVHFRVQPLQRLRGFHRIQVFALDVLDERNFEDPLVRIILDDGRNFDQTSQLGRAQTTLAGDQLVAGAFATNQERLDYPMCFYGVSEFFQPRGIEYRARLQRVRLDVGRSGSTATWGPDGARSGAGLNRSGAGL